MSPLRLMACAAFTAMVLSTPPPAAAAETARPIDHARVTRAALTQHIQPGFRALVDAFANLGHAAANCTGVPAFKFTTLRPAFRRAVLAWGRVAHLNFGPLVEENRYERIYFWLDRKGIARRQVARALKSKPAAYLDAAELGQLSIGVQGLAALEQLIVTPPRPDDDATFKCGYARAITQNLERMAEQISNAWDNDRGWAGWLLKPGKDNPRFIKIEETTYTLARAFLEHSDRIRDVELLRPLGMSASRRKLPGPFARSRLTMPFLASRIAGLRSLVIESGLAEEILSNARGRGLSKAIKAMKQVQFELRFSEELSQKLGKVPDFFTSRRVNEAIALGFPLKSARAMFQLGIGLTTDLPTGFNASDGD